MTDMEFITAIKQGGWSKNFIEKYFGKVRDKQDLLDLMIEEAFIDAYDEPPMMFDEHLVTISELLEPTPLEYDNLWRAITFAAQHYGLTTGLEKGEPEEEKEQETAKEVADLRSIIVDDYDKDEVMSFFRSMIKPHKPTHLACMMDTAIKWCMFCDKPTFKLIEATFGKGNFSQSGYNHALKNKNYDRTGEKALSSAFESKFGKPPEKIEYEA